jgi:hypothetical protein
MKVFVVTSIFSIFAYLWMIYVLEISTPNVIDLWEALVTLFCFPLLIIVAWWADNDFFRCCCNAKPRAVVLEQLEEAKRLHALMMESGKKGEGANKHIR